MKYLLLILTFVVTLSNPIQAQQQFDKGKLDELFSILNTNQKAMGSVSIFKNGEQIYQNTIGYADVKEKIRANNNTTYRIGSISKTFTAVLIFNSIEAGKLTLDTQLSTYFPEIPNANKITVEHLLRHQSGVFSITDDKTYTDWMESPQSRADLLQKITRYKPEFEPGSTTKYSNSGYILLSMILEEVEGERFYEILEEYIVNPLHLEQTYYGSTIKTEFNEAQSYTLFDKWENQTETHTSIPIGAGSLVSTPYDLNVFFDALFNEKLISKSSLDKMTTLQNNLGMGLFKIPFYDRFAFGHTGGIDGFQSNSAYFPEDKVTITYLSNGVVTPINDIMIGVLSIYFGKPYELPNYESAFKVDVETLESYLGTYSTPSFPLKMTIKRKGDQLYGQGTGQPEFPLEAYEEHKFRFEQAQLKIEFQPEKKELILKQGPGQYIFKKES